MSDKSFPASGRSAGLYLRLPRSRVRLFRYLLEARDNLACISVIDREACVLRLFCASEQYPALLECLEEIGIGEICFEGGYSQSHFSRT
ncbi:MAG: DUF4911 domain-containing protein [Desulfovibrionaceae bacterium]|nr:DUF4911 domain-containing protein [Desulfovibrionaceae bacterium]